MRGYSGVGFGCLGEFSDRRLAETPLRSSPPGTAGANCGLLPLLIPPREQDQDYSPIAGDDVEKDPL